MTLLVACPVILPPRADVVASWTHRPHLLILNGAQEQWRAQERDGFLWSWTRPLSLGAPVVNQGVAASWNNAFRVAHKRDIDHVALISQGVVLDGGTARLAELVDEHADERGLLTDFAWHCIVISVRTWLEVGPFDETFSPAYYEDSDYVRRMFLAGVHTPTDRMPKVDRDLLDGTETVAAAMHLIPPDTYRVNGHRYVEKWGGPPFKERFEIPYVPGSATDNNWTNAEQGTR